MNPYKVLKIKKDATNAEIKKAYRNLSKIHHPDVGGDEEKFQELNLAYRVLSDEKKRRMYDESGVIMDEAEDHIENMVKAKLAMIGNDWLDNMIKGRKVPIQEFVVDKLDTALRKIASINVDLKTTINDAENVLNRLSYEQEHSVIHEVIKQRIQTYKSGIQQNNGEIEIIKQTREIILNYDYDAEEGAQQEGHSLFIGSDTVHFRLR